MKTNRRNVVVIILLLVCHYSAAQYQKKTAYFISNEGNKFNIGSINSPYCALDSELSKKINAGDTVYFKGGEVFETSLYIDCLLRGTQENPIVITSYGGQKAIIKSGNRVGFLINNSQYINLEYLHFIGNGRNNGNTSDGVCVSNSNHIRLKGLEIEGYQKAGLEIYCSKFIISDEIFSHDNGYAGIDVYGVYGRKDASSDITITHCKAEDNPGNPIEFENHSGNGIVVGQCKNITIEYCTATNNGWDMPRKGNGPVGIWAYEADSVIIQYCISYRNKTSKGSQDGGGFDFDGGITNSIIQYCLSYENEGAGYSLFQYKGASPWYNNIIRYCVSENDGNVSNGMGGFFIWNSSENEDELKQCYIYNNTVYNAHGGVICYESKSKNKDFYFINNIFVGKDMLNKGVEPSSNFYGNNWYSLSGTGFNITGFTNFNEWVINKNKETFGQKILGYNIEPLFINAGNTTLTDPEKLALYNAYQLKATFKKKIKGLNINKLVGIKNTKFDFNRNRTKKNFLGAFK
ncbi:MAG: Pectate lyase superfamily protein [Bacteroidetes bacterium]|nr:Pectate lyase superfamily protein [Bacteroidota bacterium]